MNIIHNSGSQKYHSVMKYTLAMFVLDPHIIGSMKLCDSFRSCAQFFPYSKVVILSYDSSLTISLAPFWNMTATLLGLATWRTVFCDASTRAGSASWRTQGRDL